MKEKKTNSIKMVAALCIVLVIFLVGSLGMLVNYISIINDKDRIIAVKDSQIEALTKQVAQLQAWLDGNKTRSQQEIQKLNKQIRELEQSFIQVQQQMMNLRTFMNSLMMPKLIKVDLKAEDIKSLLGEPHLHVYGYVCNVGTYAGLNSTIHVVAFQSGGVLAIDAYIDLAEIDGESWKSVDSKIHYTGSELLNWTLTLEWKSPPLPV